MAQTGRSGLNSATQRNVLRTRTAQIAGVTVAKLNGIRSAKSKHATFLRNQGLVAPAPRGALDLGWHVPSPAEDGTLICGCVGSTMRYSPAAFAAHVAGRPPADNHYGVYTTGPLDPWVIEREQQVTTPASIEQRDADGWLFEPFENEFRQRMVRYLSGPNAGQVAHAPATALPPIEPRRRTYTALDADEGLF